MSNRYEIDTDAIKVGDGICFKLDHEHYATVKRTEPSSLGGRSFVVEMNSSDDEAGLGVGDEYSVWSRDVIDHHPRS